LGPFFNGKMKQLKRYPLKANELLQAWDAADELILQHMGTLDLIGKRILIINDHFGAMGSGLQEFDPTLYTDSYISYKSSHLNSEGKLSPINELSLLNGVYDFVMIQLPKNMSYFEDILCHLTQHLGSHSKIICTSMVKHLAAASFDLLNKYIGRTTTSLAQKKARLIFADFEMGRVVSPYPLIVKFEQFEHEFINHSNLFSREKLDIGTRFILEHLPKGEFEKVLDLGCANGILGIAFKKLNLESQIIFCDESKMALLSAEANYKRHFSDEASYQWTNCFEDGVKNSLDLVLCNPPFHQGHTVGDFIAIQMFHDAYESLRPGGTMRVVGNSNLAYQTKLKKIFGNSKIVATNSKFMIINSVKQT
jgi:23S rRNA (guanine1835-N2)-methyltransferase